MGSSPKPGNNGTSLAAIARPEHLGYAGRLVLVSRKWSGKTLKDHRGDREAWLIATLGLEPPDSASTPSETQAGSLDPCPRFKQDAQLAYYGDLRQSQLTIR